MLNSEGGELQFEKGRKGWRFERAPRQRIGSSEVHVVLNLKVVGDGL